MSIYLLMILLFFFFCYYSLDGKSSFRYGENLCRCSNTCANRNFECHYVSLKRASALEDTFNLHSISE